jgi:PAS domain S-box-containing protein
MAKQPDGPTKPTGLRRQAEERLRTTKRDVASMPVKDVQQLVHELQVHQIELEMQNEELRRTQIELEAARDRYADLYDFSPAGHLLLDREGTIIEANLRAGTLLGINRKDLIEQPLSRFVASEDQDRLHRHCQEVLKPGTRQTCEVRMRNEARAVCCLYLESVAVHEEPGRIPYWRMALLDITERKQAEEALRQSEERWQLAATGTTDGIWAWDVARHTVFLSGRWKQVRGYREEEIGVDETEWSSRIHPEDSSRVMATVQSYLNKEIPTFDCEYRTRGKDGTYYWVRDRGIALWDEQGRVVRMVGSETDITERKRAEEALHRSHDELEHRVVERTSELDRSNERLCTEIAERNTAELSLHESDARLQGMLDHSPNLIFMKDLQGHYVDVNKQFEQTFHLTRQDIIGKSDQDIFPPEQAAAYRANDLEVLKTGRSIQFEEVALHDDGLQTNIVWKFPLRRQDDTPYAICGIATDITKLKQGEKVLHQKQLDLQSSQAQLQCLASQLLEAQEGERQRIARDLHDDFSQRLTALVLDVASLAKRPPRLPELLGKALQPVCKELEQLTRDLHDLAYRLHPPLLRHAGLQAAIEDHIHKAMERTGLRISLKAKDAPSSIPLEWSLCLFRVLQESLQNIVKHAKATEVLVKLSGSSKGVGLSVIDNGKGFDKHNKSGHQKGLGLISMQERLRLLNGFLNIHSRPADGTKVCAWIPFLEKTA